MCQSRQDRDSGEQTGPQDQDGITYLLGDLDVSETYLVSEPDLRAAASAAGGDADHPVYRRIRELARDARKPASLPLPDLPWRWRQYVDLEALGQATRAAGFREMLWASPRPHPSPGRELARISTGQQPRPGEPGRAATAGWGRDGETDPRG